jgi:hypothetical protein
MFDKWKPMKQQTPDGMVAAAIAAMGVAVKPGRTTVWKYTLNPTPSSQRHYLNMAQGAVPLFVGVQGDDLILWALVNPSAPKVNRHYFVLGTGHRVEENGPNDLDEMGYVGTSVMHDPGAGDLVWHVFVGGEY